jgi:hypothetical protein
MQQTQYQQRMSQLLAEMRTLEPAERQRLELLAATAVARHSRLERTLGRLQTDLDNLRVGIKYLVFDLEATRRENAQLRRRLDDRGQAPHP